MKYVKVGISVPKINPYEAMLKRKNHPSEGMDQWDEVANVLNKQIKIDIAMSPQNLFKDLFYFSLNHPFMLLLIFIHVNMSSFKLHSSYT